MADEQATPQLWQALAQARLRLAGHAEFTEQVQRGQLWVVIYDPVRNQFYKTTPEVYRLLQQLDGSRTLAQVLAASAPLRELFAGGPQALNLLAQLLEAGLLLGDLRYDYQVDLERQRQKEKQAGRRRWQRLWMLKLPLWNPDRMLLWLYRRTWWLWTRPAFLLWLATMVAAAVVLVDYWPHLREFWQTRFLDPLNLLLLLMIYPCLKACHELAHGLTTKKWGGQVYELGVMLLVFMPVPYVDASASARFPEKYQRILVAASGVMTELFCAALALFIWLSSDNILVKDICLNIMLIGAVSSLLFNGNPLLRFDAYYALSDWLEIPNLSGRANYYLRGAWQKGLLGLDAVPLALTPGEKKWLIGYGLAAGVYRLLIGLGVAAYIAGQYFFVGVLLALWVLWLQWLAPLAQSLRADFAEATKHRRQGRFLLGYTLLIGITAALLFAVPVPDGTAASGLATVAGPYRIKTDAEGFLQEILVHNGAAVAAGQPLLVLHNPSLASEIASLQAQIAEAEILLQRALARAPGEAGEHRDDLTRLKNQLADLEDDRLNLTVVSGAAGTVAIDDLDNLAGRYFSQGETLGQVLAPGAVEVVAVVPERAGRRLAGDLREVRVKLRAHPQREWRAKNVRFVPLASRQLPDAYLGSLFGGSIPVDTSVSEGTRALEPVFQVVIELPADAQLQPATGRAQVLFVHDSAPLGVRLLAYCRVELLRRFNI